VNRTVTVLVPCFNQKPYILPCLESIREQTFEDFQAIILDDHSTDGTADVISTFLRESADPRFRHERSGVNLGSTRNFNRGLSLVRSERIAFIAGDDYWDPDFLRLMTEQLDGQGVDYAFSQTVMVNDAGERLDLVPAANLRLDTSEGIHRQMLRGNVMGGHSIIFRREVVDRCGPFDETFRFLSDWEFHLRVTKFCRGTHLKKPLALYRIHGSNLGIRQYESDSYLEEIITVLEKYVLEAPRPPAWRDILVAQLTDVAASYLYNHNYDAVRALHRFGRKHLGVRIFLSGKLSTVYLLSIMGSDAAVGAVARIRRKRFGHI
jgi:glycosyltransferase involved in cell wall biosynthesis